MSDITQITQTRNQLHNDFDVSKLLIWNPRTDTDTFLNDTGGPLNLVGGEVLGQLTAAPNRLVILESAAVDGSQTPVGINCTCVDVADTATTSLTYITFGDVPEEKLIFAGADTINTTVGGRTLGALLRAQGINPVAGTELTKVDNP